MIEALEQIIQAYLRKVVQKENIVVFALIAIYTWIFVNPLKNAAVAMKVRVASYTYLFMINDHVVHLTMLSVFLLFLAVVLNDSTSFIQCLEKWGFKVATVGHIIFAMIIVLLFQAITIAVANVIMSPVQTLDLKWGEGWNLLSIQKNLNQFSPMFYPSAFLIEEYSAQEATIKTLLFETALLLSLTLLTSVLINLANKIVAFLFDIVLILSDLLFYNLYPIPFRKFSLVSLCMLDTYQKPEVASGITEQYARIVFIAVLALALLTCFACNYLLCKKRIEVSEVKFSK